MGTMDVSLWILFAINTVAYRTAKVIYAKYCNVAPPVLFPSIFALPRHQRPLWASRLAMLEVAVMVPPIIYVALILAGFFFGETGWILFAVSYVVLVAPIQRSK